MLEPVNFRGTTSVQVLIRLAEERGMPATETLEGTGLRPLAALEAAAPVSVAHELRIVANVVSRFGREPGLGVEAARRRRVPLFGPWGLALLGSRSLREIIAVTRYLDRTVSSTALSLETDEREARVVFDPSITSPAVRAFLAERYLAGVPAVSRALFDHIIPVRRVTFRHQGPRDTVRYRRAFGVEPVFGAGADSLVFDRAHLDVPLPRPHDWARGLCEQLCRELLNRRRVRTGVAGTVRDLLIRDPARLPDQTAVAGALFMSPRTLSRRLNEEGTSFRALLDEVREVVADELLAHTPMTTEHLATRLGYSEAASFIRAFRRWKGCPPQEFRARLERPSPRLAVAG